MWKKIIDKNLIVINPEVKNKKDLFEKIVNHVYNHDYILNQKAFLKALIAREEMSNTELIKGVALPHAKGDFVEKLFLSILIFSNGIDYNNLEMGPAKIIFFLGCPNQQNKEYLQLLAKSSRLLKNDKFRENLIKAQSKDEIINLLESYYEEDNEEIEKRHYLMILTLNKKNNSIDVLNSFVEAGITNSSIVDAQSMAKKLAYELPVFAGLSYMAHGKSKESQLYFSYIREKNDAKKLQRILRESGIDLDKQGVGFIQIISIDSIFGNFEEDIDL